jgi:hypothetical protein
MAYLTLSKSKPRIGANGQLIKTVPQKKIHSILIKILLSAVQLNSLAARFDFKWPGKPHIHRSPRSTCPIFSKKIKLMYACPQ